MYVIITKNMNLIRCFAGAITLQYESVDKKLTRNLNSYVMISTTNRNFATLALFDGAKVYGSNTLSPLIPECESVEELTDKLINILLEALGIYKTIRGYDYLKYMIKCHIEDENYCMKPMGKVVYPECARSFNVSSSMVSKYANLALKTSYARNKQRFEVIYISHYGSDYMNEPKAAGFVTIMAEKIRALLPKQ